MVDYLIVRSALAACSKRYDELDGGQSAFTTLVSRGRALQMPPPNSYAGMAVRNLPQGLDQLDAVVREAKGVLAKMSTSFAQTHDLYAQTEAENLEASRRIWGSDGNDYPDRGDRNYPYAQRPFTVSSGDPAEEVGFTRELRTEIDDQALLRAVINLSDTWSKCPPVVLTIIGMVTWMPVPDITQKMNGAFAPVTQAADAYGRIGMGYRAVGASIGKDIDGLAYAWQGPAAWNAVSYLTKVNYWFGSGLGATIGHAGSEISRNSEALLFLVNQVISEIDDLTGILGTIITIAVALGDDQKDVLSVARAIAFPLAAFVVKHNQVAKTMQAIIKIVVIVIEVFAAVIPGSSTFSVPPAPK